MAVELKNVTARRRLAQGVCVRCAGPPRGARQTCAPCAEQEKARKQAARHQQWTAWLQWLRDLPEPAPDPDDPQHPARCWWWDIRTRQPVVEAE